MPGLVYVDHLSTPSARRMNDSDLVVVVAWLFFAPVLPSPQAANVLGSIAEAALNILPDRSSTHYSRSDRYLVLVDEMEVQE